MCFQVILKLGLPYHLNPSRPLYLRYFIKIKIALPHPQSVEELPKLVHQKSVPKLESENRTLG